jgi:sugar phosphate permease
VSDPLARTRWVRWWILLVPALLYVCSYFHRIAPVVVAGDLMRDFGVTAAALGNLSAIYPYCFAAMALPGGSLADTLGPRWTLTLGGLTMGAGTVLFGLAEGFGVAFAGRLLVGLGASVLLLASLRLAAEWFRTDEFATVSGLSQTVGSLGALIATTPLALLVEATGWRHAFVAIGTATLVIAVACALAVRDRPAALGLAPVNPSRPGSSPGLRAVLSGIPAAAGNRLIWAPILTSTCLYAGFGAFIGLWGIPYLTHVYALRRIEAANLMAGATLGLLVAAPLVGWLSDRWGRRRPLILGTVTLAVAAWIPLACVGAPLPRWALMPLCAALGVSSGGVVLVFACLREMSDPRQVGVTLGVHNLPIFLGFALMQWLIGVALDRWWEGADADGVRVYSLDAYRAGFALCLLSALAALAAASRVRETHGRSIWRGER